MEPALQDDDAKNGPPNEWARMAKKLREIAADIEAEPIPDGLLGCWSLRPIGYGLQALPDKHALILRFTICGRSLSCG